MLPLLRRELRRYENRLIIIGTGIALIGIWSVTKVVMSFLLNYHTYSQTLMLESIDDDLLVYVVITIVVFLIMVLLSHLYIARCARMEGMGRQKKNGYLIFTAIYTILYAYAVSDDIKNLDTYYDSLLDGIVEAIMDITVVVTLIELIVAGAEVKHLRRTIEKQED